MLDRMYNCTFREFKGDQNYYINGDESYRLRKTIVPLKNNHRSDYINGDESYIISHGLIMSSH